MRYCRLAAASLRDNLPCSWCHRVDIGTAVSLDRSAYVLEFGELLVPTRTASAGSIALVMVVVCEGAAVMDAFQKVWPGHDGCFSEGVGRP